MVWGLAAIFIGWLLYRGLVKRDLLQHRGTLVLGTFFMGIWGLLGWFLWV
jgi:hypothetical protein